jgi:hypothetical protein
MPSSASAALPARGRSPQRRPAQSRSPSRRLRRLRRPPPRDEPGLRGTHRRLRRLFRRWLSRRRNPSPRRPRSSLSPSPGRRRRPGPEGWVCTRQRGGLRKTSRRRPSQRHLCPRRSSAIRGVSRRRGRSDCHAACASRSRAADAVGAIGAGHRDAACGGGQCACCDQSQRQQTRDELLLHDLLPLINLLDLFIDLALDL